MSETATPNVMPKAQETAEKSTETEASTSTAATDTLSGMTAEERTELDRYRAIHKDESKWEKRAKSNFDDAEKYRQLMTQLGGDPGKGKEFDPQSAIADLNNKLENERLARIRSEVARTEGVDPDDFSGSTEEEMRSAAQSFKAKIQAKIDAAVEAALKGKSTAAAPASEVTASGKVDGVKQLSRDDLKNMSPKDILAAKNDGRLDALMGRT